MANGGPEGKGPGEQRCQHQVVPGETQVQVTRPGSEDQQQRYEVFLNYKRDLGAARNLSFESFDQAVLTLSSAALGLSLVFIKDIVDLDQAVVIPALVVSWISFGLAILSTVGSFVSSRIAIDAQLDLAERGLLNGEDNALEETPKAATWTGRLNSLSAAAFASGIVSTLVFVIWNLFGG